MKTKTSFILKAVNIIFWIIFIGLCIKTGGLLISYFISVTLNAEASQNLNLELNLYELYNFGVLQYSIIVFALVLLTGLKAYIGYWIIKIFIEMKLENPFSESISRMIEKIGKIAVISGILALIAKAYSDWLIKNNVAIPINWSYGEILFFAGVIYIIAQIFKRGMELQSENEFTI